MYLLQASLYVLRLSLVVLRRSWFGFGPRMTTLGQSMTVFRASLFVLRPNQVVLGRSMYVLGRRNIMLGPNIHRPGTGIAILDPLRREMDASDEENHLNPAGSGSRIGESDAPPGDEGGRIRLTSPRERRAARVDLDHDLLTLDAPLFASIGG
jgi:hypothetical protein